MTSGGLAAVSSSAFAALYSAFGKYDVVHIHAEGPAFFTWLPKMFGKRVVVTVHGIDSMVEELKQYAQNNSLKIIGAGDYKTYYDEGFINLSPYEWVDLFRNAEKIITGTFHGTVFSIKYEKPVVCYPTEKNRINKIHSLLEDMKIPSRLLEIGREKELINMLNKPMNYMQTQEYIARKVQEADEFLVGEKR